MITLKTTAFLKSHHGREQERTSGTISGENRGCATSKTFLFSKNYQTYTEVKASVIALTPELYMGASRKQLTARWWYYLLIVDLIT